MEDWNLEEQKTNDKDKLISKVLITMMIFLAIIIVVIIALLFVIKENTVVLSIDNKNMDYSERLIKTENNIKFVNIKEMSELVGAQYHLGEYKVFSSDSDKCYIQFSQETSSFYLNSDKICKLKVGDMSSDYDVCNCSTNIIKINDEFYAPIDAIEIGFNIVLNISDKKIEVMTLPALVNTVENKINKENKYNSLQNEDFDNQKALLYGYIIASKADSNLYTVLSLNDNTEIVSDRYKKIDFLEPTKEFLVTNSIDKVGIIDSNGQNKIEQIYDSIKIINNNPKLYMVELDEKFGVIDENGNTIIHNEYESIGIDSTKYLDINNQYVLLDKVIPVQKDKKYGLFDINGNKLLDVKYNAVGCDISSVEVESSTKSVTPVLGIEECNGIVIKNEENYDLYLIDNNELISLKVASIYAIKESGKTNYYMIYKGQEMNLIENLIKLGYIKDTNTLESNNKDINTITNTLNNVTHQTNAYNIVNEQGVLTNKVENSNTANQLN